MAEEKLIEAVRSFPCLWQVSNKNYKDIKARENAWKAVSEQVKDLSSEECPKRWKTLRDKFVRELKKVKYRKTGEAGPVYVSVWVYFNMMLFLEDSVRHKPTTSNFVKPDIDDSDQAARDLLNCSPTSIPDESEDTETPLSSPILTPQPSPAQQTPQPPVKKRKVNSKTEDIDIMILDNLKDLKSKRESTQLELTEEDLFGKEVALALKRLHPRQKALGKMEIQQILFKYEFGISMNESSDNHYKQY